MRSPRNRDHPRVGGEKLPCSGRYAVLLGSPPRRRGKAKRQTRLLLPAGITPAWAGKRRQWEPCPSPERDHPRVGGEKMLDASRALSWVGSPPRRRGKVCADLQSVPPEGITPAWAGKSLFCFTAAVPIQDHPRVGGEKRFRGGSLQSQEGSPPHRRGKGFLSTSSTLLSGSPPHRRGKANWHCVRRPALRITPAHAGKRTRSWRAYGCPWDHPRMGGEKRPAFSMMDSVSGSPPHGRGKVHHGILVPVRHGITPA